MKGAKVEGSKDRVILALRRRDAERGLKVKNGKRRGCLGEGCLMFMEDDGGSHTSGGVKLRDHGALTMQDIKGGAVLTNQ